MPENADMMGDGEKLHTVILAFKPDDAPQTDELMMMSMAEATAQRTILQERVLYVYKYLRTKVLDARDDPSLQLAAGTTLHFDEGSGFFAMKMRCPAENVERVQDEVYRMLWGLWAESYAAV